MVDLEGAGEKCPFPYGSGYIWVGMAGRVNGTRTIKQLETQCSHVLETLENEVNFLEWINQSINLSIMCFKKILDAKNTRSLLALAKFKYLQYINLWMYQWVLNSEINLLKSIHSCHLFKSWRYCIVHIMNLSI